MQPIFVWCEHTAIGTAVRESIWLFPVIEVAHLLGLAGLGGSILLVDLRLLDLGLRDVSVASLARTARPWLQGSLVVTIASGVALFLSEAVKCYENPAFWIKLAGLAVALVFVALVRTRFTNDERHGPYGVAASLAGATSIVLWTGVAAAGRGIGFW